MTSREVTLDGGSPWGFRMYGGADLQQPLRIARVNPGSKAAQRGIREGDLISSINGQSTRTVTNSEAHALLRNAGDKLTLGLNQEITGSPKRRSQKLTHESKEDTLKRTSITGTSSTVSNTSTITRVITNSEQCNEICQTNGATNHKKSKIKFCGMKYPSMFGCFKCTKRMGVALPWSSSSASSCSWRARFLERFAKPWQRQHNKFADLRKRRRQLDGKRVKMRDLLRGNGGGGRNAYENSDESCQTGNYISYIKNGTPNTSTRGPRIHLGASDDQSRDNAVSTAIAECRDDDSDRKCESQSVIDAQYSDNNTVQPLADILIMMPENVSGSSRSRRRRNRKKSKRCQQQQQAVVMQSDGEVPVCETDCDTPPIDAQINSAIIETYRVESPKTVPGDKKQTKTSNMVKSRSLDDDDQVKITEVSDEEKNVNISESVAIVSEAESDVEWEIVSELETQKETSEQQFGKLSVITLPLEEYRTFEPSHISPEDENSLRDFLEGLNLVNSPEESVKRIEKTANENTKARKAKKRAALAQHFLPYYENPRYLDVISEEGSDLSDRDNRHHAIINQIVDVDDDDDVFEDAKKAHELKFRNKFQSHYVGMHEHDDAILVGTKLIDNNDVQTGHVHNSAMKEGTWSTAMVETRSGAEVVYLEDSSNSMTPSDLLDQEETAGDADADDEEDMSIDLDKSLSESFDMDTNVSESSSLIKTDASVASSSNTTSRVSLPIDDHIKIKITPPSTPNSSINSTEELSEFSNKKTIDFPQELSNDNISTTAALSNKNTENLPANANKENVPTKSCETNQAKNINLDNTLYEIKVTEKVIKENSSETEDELNKELRNLCDRLREPNDEYANQMLDRTSASRSGSACSARSSSRSTSQSTVLYNPMHSSLTNIAAMLRESSFDDRSPSSEPSTLREICVKTLLTMPFGRDVIEELANVSLSIEEMTSLTQSHSPHNNPESIPAHKSPPPTTHNDTTNTDACSVLLVDNPPVVRKSTETMDAATHEERWIGMPTEENPKLLLCLSPAQKELIDRTKSLPHEADSLLDLHRKYCERRSYHEEYEQFPNTSNKTKDIPAFKLKIEPKRESNNLFKIIQNSSDENCMKNSINYNDYVKQFTHEIPVHVLKSSDTEPNIKNGNIRYDKYIKQLTREVPIQVERQINKPVNNKIYLPDNSTYTNTSTNTDIRNERLHARHLGEWLNLARNECDIINNFSANVNRLHNLRSPVTKLVSQRSFEEKSTQSTDSKLIRGTSPRRYSLPFNLYEQQMQYILEKEREVQREIEKLKEEKTRLENDMNNDNSPTKTMETKEFDAANYQISRKGDIAILQIDSEKLASKFMPASTSERFRQEMYNEYMCKVAERQERKQNKVIKIKISPIGGTEEHSTDINSQYEVRHVSGIEDEFMNKVKERMGKLGISDADDATEDEDKKTANENPVFVMDGASLSPASNLPKHLQEFIDYAQASPPEDDGVWSPGKGVVVSPSVAEPERKPSPPKVELKSDEPAAVVWTPRSAGSSPTAERKEFRPISFESPVLGRKNQSKESTPVETPECIIPIAPPWDGAPPTTQEVASSLSTSLERKLTTSHSAPAAGLNNLSKLPKAQNPTITLLQKAREGQLPRGASYIEDPPSPKPKTKDGRPPLIGPNEILYSVKNEYMSESDSEKPKKMADLGPRKFEGIGPTTKDGMPIVLRSIYDHHHHQEVKESNQAKWYKRMYDTLHRARNDDEYVTVRYKTRRGRYPYTAAAGYLSEPEPNAYDSDYGQSASKYATLDRRRLQPNKDKENEFVTYTVPRNKYMSASVKHSQDVYKNQPGRIENYVPGHSSISEKEAKEWWDEVMEIFDGWLDDHAALPSLNYMLSQVTTRSHLEQQKHVPPNKSYMSHALKESGYESDSTLVFRRREDAALQLNPHQQKEAYKHIQKGGEVPHYGLRKAAPERPKDDSELEYFPISPTLTRIRIHKNVKPVNEVLCYPVTVHHQPSVFSTYKRTAPSSSTSSSIPQPPKLPTRPPSPPKRRSSRNSHTLRLISTMTIHHHSPKSARRHETCFKSADKSNVKFLRDRISHKLKSPSTNKKTVKVTKTISTYPASSRESLTTSVSSVKDLKSPTNKIKTKSDVTCKSDHHYSRSTASSTSKRCCRHCSFSVPPKLTETKPTDKTKTRSVSLERTFGTEKRKVDLTLPKIDSRLKLVKSPDLVSPTEVKKGVQKQKDIFSLEQKYPPGTTVKRSTSLFSSAKNGLKNTLKPNEKSINVTVAMSEHGKEILKASLSPKSIKSTKTSPILSRSLTRTISRSPAPSSVSDKSKSSSKSRSVSIESLQSPPIKKRNAISKAPSITRLKSSSASSKEDLLSDREKKKKKKSKKDQSNEEIKKDKKSQKTKVSKVKENDKTKNKKCAGRAAGTEIIKKLKKMENVENSPPNITQEIIEERHKDIFQSDSFFQHLFLRDILTSPTPSSISKSSYVIERTKMLQNSQSTPFYSEPTVQALKVYLSHRKPVSESKFKTLDREIQRSRSSSPYGLMRSFSTRENRFDSISEVSNEDTSYNKENFDTESIRTRRSSSLPATKIIFTETSRPVSPVCERTIVKYSKKPSPSTSPIRSPSRRKIHSIKPPASITVEGISGIKKKAVRARSAGEAETMKREMYYSEKSITPSVSSTSLNQISDPSEYKTYVTELRHSTRKGERFKELNKFYTSLERLSQLEHTTSSSDLRPRRKHEEEIIDYDRWMQVRTRERAEQEFNTLYRKLRQDQREKDLLFRTKDVDNFRWKRDREFGLKIKEQSVENIKEQFEKLKDSESPLEISKRRILDYQKDVYKPLWRGNSVLNLVSKIAEKRSQSESRVMIAKQKLLSAERLLSREIGSKLWSSLSVEQVNALKNQLAEIYSHAPQTKRDDYSINVEPQKKISKPSTLTIRRNSANELTTGKPQQKKEHIKSSSIGSISSSQLLSETEKKRLSLSLSREAQDRMSQRKKYKSSLSIVLGKETRGAIAAAEANVKPLIDISSPRTCYSLEPTEDDSSTKQKTEKDFLLVLTKDESEEQKQNVQKTLDEWAQPKSDTIIATTKKGACTSETESASSDTSTKTAIYVGKQDELHKKIEYFERGADIETYVPTIYKPAEDDIDDVSDVTDVPVKEEEKKKERKSNLVTSQSYADLKELFGERELIKFATIPLSATRKHSYMSPQRPLLRMTNISPIRTVSEASSCESLFRSRSISPESEKFWNAYLNLIKGVDVRKLTEKFESLKDFYSNRKVSHSHRRTKSDPELLTAEKRMEMYGNREFGDVYWLRKQYESISRGRSRTRRHGRTSPIPKTPIRVEDRLMPHINIISKLASLYRKKPATLERHQSNEELAQGLGCPIGEVEKKREKFESPERNVSLLGHMFTSSPNVHELRDIAPYLTGPWIAHQYPRFQDNTRSLSAPEETIETKTLVRRDRPRPKSASPPRISKQPSSILKSHQSKDIFANQKYDPNIHRPAFRYQPHSPKTDRNRTRSWSPIAKHSVTFKGGRKTQTI